MNKIDYPELELAKQLQGILFIELAKKNGCEHDIVYWNTIEPDNIPRIPIPSRTLMWDALPDWVFGYVDNLGTCELRDLLDDFVEENFAEDEEKYFALEKILFDVFTTRGYAHTQSLAELWIFLKENNLIEGVE